MKCPDCGRELDLVAEMTVEEAKSINFIINKMEMVNELIQFRNDFSKFSDEQIKDYIASALSEFAEAKFNDIKLFNEIKNKYCPTETREIKFLDGKVYVHKD